MKGEVVKREQQLPADAPTDLLSVIAHAVADPRMDVDKMSKLLDMQERIMENQRRQVFAGAMAKLQARLPQIRKDGQIVVNGQERSRYAKLEDIDTAIRPLLAEFGFSFSFNEESVDGKNRRYSAKISHEDGHSETKYLTLVLDESGSKNAAQSAGSTFAYARRYLLKAHLNLIERDEDMDGNDPAKITEDQAKDLEAAIDEVKMDRGRFLVFMGVGKVADILASDMDKALNAIDVKRRAVK